MLFFGQETDTPPQDTERRSRGKRHRCDIPVVVLQPGYMPVMATIKNISESGAYVVLTQNITVANLIDIKDRRDGELYRVKCRWQRGRSIGISFYKKAIQIDCEAETSNELA